MQIRLVPNSTIVDGSGTVYVGGGVVLSTDDRVTCIQEPPSSITGTQFARFCDDCKFGWYHSLYKTCSLMGVKNPPFSRRVFV